MNDGTYHHFYKPNHGKSCIHVKFNHALQFIKKISSLVEERLSRQSRKKENIFLNSKDYYKQHSRQYGCDKILNYTEEKIETNSKPRKRKTHLL